MERLDVVAARVRAGAAGAAGGAARPLRGRRRGQRRARRRAARAAPARPARGQPGRAAGARRAGTHADNIHVNQCTNRQNIHIILILGPSKMGGQTFAMFSTSNLSLGRAISFYFYKSFIIPVLVVV